MLRRFANFAIPIIVGFALFDVFTGWRLSQLWFPLLGVGVGIGAAAIEKRSARRIIALIATLCFALHAGTIAYLHHIENNWQQISRAHAADILSDSQQAIEGIVGGVSSTAAEVAKDEAISEAFRAGSAKALFDALAELRSEWRKANKISGLVIADREGKILAWQGNLPDSIGIRVDGPPTGLRVTISTTCEWLEARQPIKAGDKESGFVVAYRKIRPLFPNLIHGRNEADIGAYLVSLTGYDVHFDLASETKGIAQAPDVVTQEVRLPDGSLLGYLSVRMPPVDDEIARVKERGLFIASILSLLLIGITLSIAVRILLGYRFEYASNLNLFLLVLALLGVRLGFALVRDHLFLDRFRAFSSVDYATQAPLGILRSPFDLALSALIIVIAIVIVLVAKARRPASRFKPQTKSSEALPMALLAVICAIVAAAVVIIFTLALERFHSDASEDILMVSPFDFHPTTLLLRLGMLSVILGTILASGAILQWQVNLLRRISKSFRTRWMAFVLIGIVHLGLLAIFSIAGVNPLAVLVGALAVAFAFLLDHLLARQVEFSLIAAVLLLVAAASIVEFPIAFRDHIAKKEAAVEVLASQVAYQTDEWKLLVLEKTAGEIEESPDVLEALKDAKGGLDAFALRLWANSIISRAGLNGGIYILGPHDNIVGRFAPGEVGDISGIESVIRRARLSMQKIIEVTTATIGPRTLPVHLGLIPFFEGERYLGCIVIAIPHGYSDVESLVASSPGLFDVVGGRGAGGAELTYDLDASVVKSGRVVGTTSSVFEVGKRIKALEGRDITKPFWFEHRIGGTRYRCYVIRPEGRFEGILFSFPIPGVSDLAVYYMAVLVGYAILGFCLLVISGLIQALSYSIRRMRGASRLRLRWSFAHKLALGFVLIAIVPTLILGTASRGFLGVRFREVMESRAEEGLKLARLALERLVRDDAERFVENPILMAALEDEPSLIANLVKPGSTAEVFDADGNVVARYGNPVVPNEVLDRTLKRGEALSFFSVEGGLVAKSAFPIKDEITPSIITGCAFVSRPIDDRLARQLAIELGRDINFFSLGKLAASSSREVFVSELVSDRVSPEAYANCFLEGRERDFAWEKIGKADVVMGYSPLRDFRGNVIGAISVPVVFRKDEIGRRMEWTSAAISYLIVVVIGAIFILGLLLARRISQPIRELIQGTLRIGSGDLRFTIPRSGDDEIGDLVDSFNRMTQALARSRKALSERKRYIETIISNVGAGIISTDSRGRIDTFNPTAERILGVKGRNARGGDATRLLTKIGASGLAAVMREVNARRDIVAKEVTIARKDGRIATLRAVASIVKGPRGKPMGRVMVFEDVTELIRSKQLIAWSEMARQVAHEIKNPLTPMKLSIQHLLQCHRDGVGDFDRILEDSVATIVEQIESLRRIAVEFSQFARMPERRLEMTDVNAVLEECIKQYEQAPGEGIEIRKMLDEAIPKLRLDRDELKRVFLNLIENAVQAMPNGGTLTVRTARSWGRTSTTKAFRVSTRPPGAEPLRGYIEISFADTGVGIDPENSEYLFEPNFSTKTQGSGLGLAICKNIVDGYAGEIVIESTPGEGTTVRVRLPLPERPNAQRRSRKTDNRKSQRRPR